MLTPLLTFLLRDKQGMIDYGNMSVIYAWIAASNIVFTYGMETAYFRFSNKEDSNNYSIFETSFGSLLISTIVFSTLISFFDTSIAKFLTIDSHPEYIVWCGLLIGLDALTAIPFAKLRQENNPKKYAYIKFAGIILNMVSVIFLIVYAPKLIDLHFRDTALASWYNSKDRLGFILFANLIQNLFVFILLFREWKYFRMKLDFRLWKKMVTYSAPMIVIGLAGMINEVMDRQFLIKWLPFSLEKNKTLVAVYSANYRLAIFISLFIQAFKLAAEPFFFNNSKNVDAAKIYARIMKWFVITLTFAFLFTALYLNTWQALLLRGSLYRTGIAIVPILLLANIFLGIYYNLSFWYKVKDKLKIGIYITLFGASITFVGNYFFIPRFGIFASAWTTLICYLIMMITAYLLGQKYYPIHYETKKLIFLILLSIIFYLIHVALNSLYKNPIFSFFSSTIIFLLYFWIIWQIEKKEINQFPIIRKLFMYEVGQSKQ